MAISAAHRPCRIKSVGRGSHGSAHSSTMCIIRSWPTFFYCWQRFDTRRTIPAHQADTTRSKPGGSKIRTARRFSPQRLTLVLQEIRAGFSRDGRSPWYSLTHTTIPRWEGLGEAYWDAITAAGFLYQDMPSGKKRRCPFAAAPSVRAKGPPINFWTSSWVCRKKTVRQRWKVKPLREKPKSAPGAFPNGRNLKIARLRRDGLAAEPKNDVGVGGSWAQAVDRKYPDSRSSETTRAKRFEELEHRVNAKPSNRIHSP